MSAPITIRDASIADLPAIVDLLNALLGSTTYEYTETPHTVASRRPWFEDQRQRGFPVIVAETGLAGDGVGRRVVGFASYGDFRDSVARPGFRHTVEHTVHVARQWQGRGIARSLMEALIGRAVAAEVHVMIGAIDATNRGSIEFHERLGFVEVGRLPDAARKFGRWCELVLLQRTLDTAPSTGPGNDT